ncbi:similar to Saccharomyces cerevisiae YOR108W LEU9 Alpha- isopropylmalate synthase II (2-isopropylmalate synthase), catalyzes the first step in the leucine biosynthesis pathway [Maudiozyma barnettii]|uniref:2-isopropylmalate synthase n=1 Tax=Maudiozyma barnettii TaxID=61262 RepID=A0A8H2VEU3_9SACH|nr:2-isopropylmalate synthase LEU9 [Kazachstania barnettii]CAB4254221.1 similar to Saccharomyces cerevisiae YOR108W LEU9 Alpha- isopropylmalate synthase II (2-isopropylmalate synthase), catalyzes the first step in the leucine biosynthesis pathway [Kazachstania barnettii]CAD1781955.1 similar to Saccharomyces cerevisiae YOR108W LEU9 Alpha- isopropylmalate synthase II (2-isopropylmalate synthase), catalyzes the first step in the leucine biosynthesis pathway [Kazachstania barnettii]
MVKRTIVALAEQTGRISKTIPPFKLGYKNMLKDPSVKYRAFPAPKMTERKWPNNTITKAPRWLSTDLRDGNQSLPDPMTVEQKKEYFHKLVEIGFKEIEVAFPSASQTDFDFTRYAVENAPEDVTIQALVQSREHLIKRTVESLHGAKRATIHTYLATSDMFREIVFSMSQEEAISKAVEATKLVRKLTKDDPSQQATHWSYEFSPECFSDTPTEFAVKICEAVKAAWEPTVDNPIIFNLPATVEQATPNIYADQIEYFATHISEREKVCISTHCHNDRGCAVAATELGILAGADRVEGCVFGNGERTGNVDLVTVALNMYTQGVTPNLDFSDITSIVEVSERCNKIPVSPRAPYGGDLVVCAFSGSHQDAIKKGFALQEKKRKNGDHQWKIPYLPLDPKDIGRDYEAVIRVNSQSGKGGAAWIILRSLGLDVPRNMQIDFSSAVQNSADELGRELRAEEITNLFKETYNYNNESHRYITLLNYNVERKDNERRVLTGQVEINDVVVPINGVGNGPVSSIVDALSNLVGFKLSVEHYSEHAIGSGTSTKAASFVQLRYLRDEDNGAAFKWGVGLADDVGDSSVQAILATLNNVIESGEIPVPNVAKKAKASA